MSGGGARGGHDPRGAASTHLEGDHLRALVGTRAEERIARHEQVGSSGGPHQTERGESESLHVVDQQVLEGPLAPALELAQRVANQVADVARTGVGQHPLVRAVDPGELPL